MALKKTNKVESLITLESLGELARTYDSTSATIKVMTEQKKELAESIKIGAEVKGVKDDKGSFYADCGDYIIGKVASKSIVLNKDKMMAILEVKGLLKEATDTVRVLNESKLESLLAHSPALTNEDIKNASDTVVTYKVSVKKKEVAVDIDLGVLKVAKSKKK